MDIILASASPRRAELLKKAGIKFKQVPSTIDEEAIHKKFRHENVSKGYVKKFVREVALAKLAPFTRNDLNKPVVTADTVVYFEGRIIGKPHTKEKCREQHLMFSGKTNYVFTAVAVHYNGKTICVVKCRPTKVAKLQDEVIETICNEPYTLDCAGYRSSGAIGPYLKIKKQHEEDVAGLSVSLLLKMLRRVGFTALDMQPT